MCRGGRVGASSCIWNRFSLIGCTGYRATASLCVMLSRLFRYRRPPRTVFLYLTHCRSSRRHHPRLTPPGDEKCHWGGEKKQKVDPNGHDPAHLEMGQILSFRQYICRGATSGLDEGVGDNFGRRAQSYLTALFRVFLHSNGLVLRIYDGQTQGYVDTLVERVHMTLGVQLPVTADQELGATDVRALSTPITAATSPVGWMKTSCMPGVSYPREPAPSPRRSGERGLARSAEK